MLSDYDVETNTDLNELGLLTLDPWSARKTAGTAGRTRQPDQPPLPKKGKLGGRHRWQPSNRRRDHRRRRQAQDNNLSVIHLGAHPHIQDPASDGPDIMARIKEKCQVSHLGIRSMTKAEKKKIHIDNLVFARDLYNNGLNAANDAIDVLGDAVYLTINLDVLDPACMPAVVRPEPGGLDWYTLNNLIRMIAREKSIIGFDVTGLLPQKNGLHAHLLGG